MHVYDGSRCSVQTRFIEIHQVLSKKKFGYFSNIYAITGDNVDWYWENSLDVATGQEAYPLKAEE